MVEGRQMSFFNNISIFGNNRNVSKPVEAGRTASREAPETPATSPRPLSRKKVRVLLCTDHLPPSDGGVEQVVGALAARLSAQGHEVGVYTLRSPDESIELNSQADVEVFESAKTDLTDYVGLQSTVSFSALHEFGRVVSTFDPDLIHVHNRFFYTSYLGLLYSRFSECPLITSLHLGNLEYINGAGGVAASAFQSVLGKRLVRASDMVICVSEAVEEVARSLGASRTVTLHNAVDTNQFDVGRSEFDKTLLYVGRLVRNNGPHDLLQAVPGIISEHPDADVNFVGTGKLRSKLEHLADELSVSDSVTFHGFVDDILPAPSK